ncbi:hypothetical protein NM208_g14571 [Fusarium decemcellulare]|uniref:Uncharacterized protein n=1 Tax=Fusarium decemcellulare TaxID=57161 RepID=A0ACC1RHD2_9HYPO|nr:hypothetical protein NM208_g14571 [Fusarium decemcellulare]
MMMGTGAKNTDKAVDKLARDTNLIATKERSGLIASQVKAGIITPEESESESDAEPDAEQIATSVCQEDLMDVECLTYRNEGSKYHADKDDPDWVPGLSTRRIAKRNDGGDPDTSDGRQRGSTTEGETIRQQYSSEKILVVSSVMFLDIVKEAMRRRVATNPQFEVTVVDYNGAIRSLDERAEIVRQFNLRYGGPQVLLLSAAAGGTGLNLAGASRVILYEPFWASGLKQQVIGRAHRMPQEREVHVYETIAELSEIDTFKMSSVDKKQKFVDAVDPF